MGDKKKQRFGVDYRWQIVSFETDHGKFKILNLLNLDKNICRSILNLSSERFEVFMCEYAYDAKEIGWHCHGNCGAGNARRSLAKRAPWIRRVPRHGQRHRRLEFVQDEHEALEKVREFFRLKEEGDLL